MLQLDVSRLAVTSFEISSQETQSNEWSSCFPDCGGTDGTFTFQDQQKI